VLGAKSPYAALFRLSIVGVAVVVVVGAGSNGPVVVQTSTTNRCEAVFVVGPTHSVFWNAYEGVVLVPTLFTEAKNCPAIGIGLAIVGGSTSVVLWVVEVAEEVLLMFA
jgi:hypothetical protein